MYDLSESLVIISNGYVLYTGHDLGVQKLVVGHP